MKEEKKLPPKSTTSTPTKLLPNDEILSTLLRINNFDSISSIKDESLDIDLSACVTISADPIGMMNVNSLSSTDFWRVLDESAQNAQLDMTTSSDEGIANSDTQESCNPAKRTWNVGSSECVKLETPNTFSGNFLRPEPPAAVSFSPLKKNKTLSAEQQPRNHRVKTTVPSKAKMSCTIKEEPPEEFQANLLPNLLQNKNTVVGSNPISQSHYPISALNAKPPVLEATSATLQKVQKCVDAAPALVAAQAIVKCVDCKGIELHGQKELSPHQLASHRIVYKCSMCDNEFEQEAGIKKHLKTHRTVEGRKDAWKKCPECGKCLKLGSMWMHRKIHSDNKKYGCDICGQKFVQKINLTHHSRIHTAEKPHECPECQKRFQERSHLQRHQKYHAQTRSYRCDKCGKMYKTERCLKVHNLVHLEQRPFACTVCDKSFISNSKLKQHSNIHTGERPFKCNYCPRDFTNFPNWLKHTRRRHKVDHKTGEHLVNIPSYCSKKSTKTPKPPKATESNAITNANLAIAPDQLNAVSFPITATIVATPKSEVKRKKNATPKETTPTPLTHTKQQPAMAQLVKILPPVSTQNTAIAIAVVKPPTNKRERKQSTPKQMQKPTTSPIKRELLEPKTTTKQKPTAKFYPDLHCLSITSAEELIMEQALEMEECGLYDAPACVTNTDNAISSEGAAELHFKIKNEFPIDAIKEEEFISLKDTNNMLLSSSLESSPYSSPASIELSSSTMPVRQTNGSNDFRVPTFYMPSFTLNSQGSIVTNLRSHLAANTSNSLQMPTEPSSSQVHQISVQDQAQLLSTQALINHLYLPMTVNMQPNQVLPSVDTLLLSSHLFHNKNVKQAKAQHNLS